MQWMISPKLNLDEALHPPAGLARVRCSTKNPFDSILLSEFSFGQILVEACEFCLLRAMSAQGRARFAVAQP
jgi:hypothetical protein